MGSRLIDVVSLHLIEASNDLSPISVELYAYSTDQQRQLLSQRLTSREPSDPSSKIVMFGNKLSMNSVNNLQNGDKMQWLVCHLRDHANELRGLAMDNLMDLKPAHQQRFIPVINPLGVLIGKLQVRYALLEESQDVHSHTQSQERVTTSIEIEHSYSAIKQLSCEKSRLESRLNLLQLELYERDAIISNLGIQLKIRQQQARYLYSAQKVKQMNGTLQNQNKQLKQRLQQAESHVKTLTMKQQHYQSNSQTTLSKDILDSLSARLSKLSANLSGHINSENYGVSARYQQADSQQERVINKELLKIERFSLALIKKHTEVIHYQHRLQNILTECQQKLSRLEHQLLEKRDMHEDTKIKTEDLMKQIRKYTDIISKKENENIEYQDRLNQLEQLYQITYSQLSDAKIENDRLKLQIDSYVSRISDLQTSNCNIADANKKMKQTIGFQDKSFRASLQSIECQSRRAHIEQNQSTQQLTILNQQIQQLRAERDTYKQELEALSQQLERFYSNCETKNYSNESAYRKLKVEFDDYRENAQYQRRILVEEQLMALKAKYKKDIQKLKDRVHELEEVQRYAVEISNQLGFKMEFTAKDKGSHGSSRQNYTRAIRPNN